MNLAALALCAALAGATLTACPEARPTREACATACERTAELQHKVYMEAQLLSARDADPAALEKKLKDAWATARGGKVGKQIEDCAIQCEASGTAAQVECVLQAQTVGQIRACRKVDAAR